MGDDMFPSDPTPCDYSVQISPHLQRLVGRPSSDFGTQPSEASQSDRIKSGCEINGAG